MFLSNSSRVTITPRLISSATFFLNLSFYYIFHTFFEAKCITSISILSRQPQNHSVLLRRVFKLSYPVHFYYIADSNIGEEYLFLYTTAKINLIFSKKNRNNSHFLLIFIMLLSHRMYYVHVFAPLSQRRSLFGFSRILNSI